MGTSPCISNFTLAIELIITSAYTEKHSTSFMQVSPGQRFSFLLHTHSKPEKEQYYIQLESREFGGVTRSFAVLNYGPPATESSPPVYPPASPPLTLPPTDPSWLEYSLRPYSNPDFPIASLSA